MSEVRPMGWTVDVKEAGSAPRHTHKEILRSDEVGHQNPAKGNHLFR